MPEFTKKERHSLRASISHDAPKKIFYVFTEKELLGRGYSAPNEVSLFAKKINI